MNLPLINKFKFSFLFYFLVLVFKEIGLVYLYKERKNINILCVAKTPYILTKKFLHEFLIDHIIADYKCQV